MAFRRQTGTTIEWDQGPVAFGLQHAIVGPLVKNPAVVSDFNRGWLGVIGPIGDSIADHHTFDRELILRVCLIVVVQRNLPGQVWNVDTGVGLTSDVEVIVLEVRESLEPGEEHFQVVLGAAQVSVVAVLWVGLIIASGIADSSWLLDVEYVGLVIPWVIILCVLCSTCLQNIWSSFLQESEHGRTAWSAVEPDNKRSLCIFSIIGLKEHVVDVFRSALDWKEPRVHFEGRGSGPAWQSIQRSDFVSSSIPVGRHRAQKNKYDG